MNAMSSIQKSTEYGDADGNVVLGFNDWKFMPSSVFASNVAGAP